MVQGVIQRVNSKDWKDKKFWSFTLSGQDGWYNTGMKRPPAVDTSVKFNFKTNDKGYNEVDGAIEVVTDGEASPTGNVRSVARAAEAGDGGKSAYWAGKEARDVTNDANRELGASRNTAIALIDLALKYEVLPLPAGKAKREEFLFGVLDKYTRKLMGKDEKVEQLVAQAKTDTATVDGVDAELNDTWN